MKRIVACSVLSYDAIQNDDVDSVDHSVCLVLLSAHIFLHLFRVQCPFWSCVKTKNEILVCERSIHHARVREEKEERTKK